MALIGRPNAGKSSLYNRLTGGSAHVGNFPGITVDVLESRVKLPDGQHATLADLPGLYSLDARIEEGTDEGVARTFIDSVRASGRPLVIVQVLDATQLALGLRLTRELLALPIPLMVVATQCDLLEGRGQRLDAQALGGALGVPTLAVSARDPATKAAVLEGIGRLTRADARLDGTGRPDTLDIERVVERCLRAESTDDRAVQRRIRATERFDALLLHPVLGPVSFVAIMTALFALVFLMAEPVTQGIDWMLGLASAKLSGRLGGGLFASFVVDGVLGGAGTVLVFMPQIVVLTVALELLEASGYLSRGAYIADRVLRLLGLSGRAFVPLLMGHACAVPAIAATRVVRHPRERLVTMLVVPLMTCSARIPTYALIIGTFFAAQGVWARSLIFVSLYLAGAAMALIVALVLRRTVVRGRSLPLVLEMPSYRWPQPAVVVRKGVQAGARFVRTVGTIIVAAGVILWMLLHVPMPGAPSRMPAPAAEATTAAAPVGSGPVAPPSAADSPADAGGELVPVPLIERSVAAAIGRGLEPLTAPLGFDWRINVGLIASFGARELMVGTLGVIHGVDDAGDDTAPLAQKLREAKRADGRPAYTTRTGLALLAFFVIACQCTSTVAAVARETRSLRWPAFVVAYTYALAWVVAAAVHGVAGLLHVP